jgi:hypothetical protein
MTNRRRRRTPCQCALCQAMTPFFGSDGNAGGGVATLSPRERYTAKYAAWRRNPAPIQGGRR